MAEAATTPTAVSAVRKFPWLTLVLALASSLALAGLGWAAHASGADGRLTAMMVILALTPWALWGSAASGWRQLSGRRPRAIAASMSFILLLGGMVMAWNMPDQAIAAPLVAVLPMTALALGYVLYTAWRRGGSLALIGVLAGLLAVLAASTGMLAFTGNAGFRVSFPTWSAVIWLGCMLFTFPLGHWWVEYRMARVVAQARVELERNQPAGRMAGAGGSRRRGRGKGPGGRTRLSRHRQLAEEAAAAKPSGRRLFGLGRSADNTEVDA